MACQERIDKSRVFGHGTSCSLEVVFLIIHGVRMRIEKNEPYQSGFVSRWNILDRPAALLCAAGSGPGSIRSIGTPGMVSKIS